ncbi:TrkH family potassium uptake protein [Indiicoccus explosivorum]|uniref:TrkH family potassium uptake protein n=1 Tax=Indiicoccus explosivorum TaxID=1917864 RepID=UPI000B445D20|nr:TrkH family potassium uptake protein [Indiicoccus explosivorum]
MNTLLWRIKNLAPAQLIATYYFAAIALSFLLLLIPGIHEEGVDVPLIDSLFTAVSAVSVTGLSVLTVIETYNVAGLIILMFIMQLGGIGIMSIGTFFWLLLGKRIGLRERQLIMIDHNQTQISGAVNLIREIIQIMLLIETAGAIILTLYFTQFYDSFGEALLHGTFTSISATTNGGFDITGASLLPYFNDYFVQIIVIMLIILGAIGFPVLIEVKAFLSSSDRLFRFSLFTKITTATFGILLVAGTAGILLLEAGNSFRNMAWHEMFFAALFQSVSSRSGGLTTIDVSLFSEATNVFMSALMFIGASPSSVGGGIRTTTFAIAILFLINFARGKNNIKVFNREVYLVDVFRAFAVIILSGFLLLGSIVILLITEPEAEIVAILFEVSSAFGTCGMSIGLTDELSTPGKFVIMALMFIGRVGLISFIFSLGGKSDPTNFHYPKERVIIG